MGTSRRSFLQLTVLGSATFLGCGDNGDDTSQTGTGGNGGTGTGGGSGSGGSNPDGGGGTAGTSAGGTGGTGVDSGTVVGPIELGSWRNSKRSLAWLYPTPDSDSEEHWRHRRAPSGVPWSIPLGVVGGGYPYNFEILSGPPGLTLQNVGFDVGAPPYYYYLTLANPEVGSSTISIRVTDQNGAQQTLNWTLEVFDANDTSRFLFFDGDSGNNANPGTQASPKRDFTGWYQGDEDEPTYQLHQCFYQGEFDIGGVPGLPYDGSGSQKLVISSAKPKTHVGYGNGATWHGNGSYIALEGGTGFYFADLTHDEPNVSEGGVRNQHLGAGSSSLAKGAIFRMRFVGSNVQSSEGSNSSCIMLADTQATGSGYCFVGCVATGITSQTVFKNYNGLDGLFEGWVIENTNGVSVVHHKGGEIRRWSTRGVKAVDGIVDTNLHHEEWINDPIARDDLEICWCSYKSLDSLSCGRVVKGAPGDNYSNIDSYRNNWQIPFHYFASVMSGVLTFQEDVLQHSGQYPNGVYQENGGANVNPVDNLVQTSGLLDPTTNLLLAGPDPAHGCQMVLV